MNERYDELVWMAKFETFEGRSPTGSTFAPMLIACPSQNLKELEKEHHNPLGSTPSRRANGWHRMDGVDEDGKSGARTILCHSTSQRHFNAMQCDINRCESSLA